MSKKIKFVSAFLVTLALFPDAYASEQTYYWMKVEAHDSTQRSRIADTGASIEVVRDDYVIAYGDQSNLVQIQKVAHVVSASSLQAEDAFHAKTGFGQRGFPQSDAGFHDYAELTTALQLLAQQNPDLVRLTSIGKTHENRDIWAIRITSDFSQVDQKPAALFIGGHHAREHISVEVPLKWAQYLVDEFRNGNTRIVSLIGGRDIHIIPAVNPDGLEFDVSTTKYQMWRKNWARHANGTFGTDLNRNYGFQWGTGGSSTKTTDETYMGSQPFSEPETRAVRDYVEAHQNISVLLSLHTFSKLILYPWGFSNSGIAVANDRIVHEKMAQTMASWNGYKPQQSSDLYIASGDTADWAYGTHKIISFTFELDPDGKTIGGGLGAIFDSKCKGFIAPGCAGFYPGAAQIQPTFQKNIEPFLYLLDHADNPYRSLQE